MFNIRLFVVMPIITIFIYSCAAAVIAYHPKDNQNDVQTRFVDGNKLATSTKPGSSVSIVSISKSQIGGGVNKLKFLVVDLVLKNNSEKELNFSPQDVQVLALNSENKIKTLKTYSPKQFIKKIKRVQNIANAANAMGNSLQNIDAGKTTSTTTTSSISKINGTANTSGSFSTNTGLYGSGQSNTQLSGNVKTNETSNTTTIDHDAKKRADKENQQELRKIREMQNSNNQQLEAKLLKINTLSPGQVVGGKVVLEYSSSYNQALQIKIPFSNDIHDIEYSIVK